MSNRELLISRITTKKIPSKLKLELQHYMEVDRDEPEEGDAPYDIANAFFDAMDFAEDNQDTGLERICKLILIDVGFYKPMSQQDINNSYVTSGRVWDFKMNGIPYRGTDSIEQWLSK
jgi:hypothetical protein